MEVSDISRALPQRHPMLLIDRVLELQPGRSIETCKAISASEPCYAGVRADAALEDYAYPISLLIESFGQSAALLWLGAEGVTSADESVLLFVGARNYRVEGSAYPGDVVRHVVRLDQVIANTAFANGETWAGPRRIATVGSLMATCRPRAAVAVVPHAKTPTREDRRVSERAALYGTSRNHR